jgi:hypothetical protein
VRLGGNTWLVVDGASGNVYRSTDDGESWTEHGNTGQEWTFYDIVFGGGQLVVVGENGQIATSIDGGEVWTAQESGTSATLVSVAYGNGRYVAVGGQGRRQTSTILTSLDGISWQPQPTGGSGQWLTSVAFGDGVFVRADNGSVSGDGLVWTTPQWGVAFGSSVVYGQAGWIIVSGGYDDGEGYVYQSVGGPVPEVEFYGNLPAGEVGQSYSYQITMEEWQVPATGYLALDLPAGLQLDAVTGLLSGTPTVAGDYQITIYAGNENGYGDYRQLWLTIYNTTTPSAYALWAAGVWGVDAANLPPEASPDSDPDGDGVPNLAEFYLGTDPRDPSSRLTLTIVGMANERVTLQVSPVVESGSYFIQETMEMTGSWSAPSALQLDGVEAGEFEHPVSATQTFYRIIYQPPGQ